MMACRRLAREAVAASLRRGTAAAPIAPARAFSAAAATAACSSSSAPVASPVRHFLARCSIPAFQPRAAELGPSLAARVALALRPQVSGRNLLKGFGTSAVVGMTLNQGKVTAATREQSPKAITKESPGSLKNELGSFWPLVRKLQLPMGLMFLIVTGWQYPLALVINLLLLIYCSRPSRYSIYLFLQEFSQIFVIGRWVTTMLSGRRSSCIQEMLKLKTTSSFLLELLNYQMEGCCISLECWAAGGSTVYHMSIENSVCRIYFSSEQRVNSWC